MFDGIGSNTTLVIKVPEAIYSGEKEIRLNNTSEEKISKMTKCDTHTKIGVSSDGKYDCYFSTNSGSEIKLLNEFKKTEIQIIEKKRTS